MISQIPTTSIPEILGSFLASPACVCISSLVLVATIVVMTLKLMLLIMEPINYELDMTTKAYCKSLAEIDNSLRFQRGANGELHLAPMKRIDSNDHDATDCATDLPDSLEARSFEDNKANAADGNSGAHSGSANHVYPNGWIPVMESFKLKAGTVKKAIVFGRDVVVTRSINGEEVNVLDAYCPHMGVHLGIGGRVKLIEKESCIECPFHGWTFRASDGQCVKIPYQKSGSKCAQIPKQAKLGSWPCVEVDNFIYVWHHVDGQQPTWFMTPSKQLANPNWQLIGRSCHRTNLELRDMHENGADMNHFEGIHNDLFIFGGELIKLQPLQYLQQYLRHHWRPEWKPMQDDQGKMTHMAEMKLQSWISVLKLRLFDITVHAHQVGPARVNLYYNSKWYGRGLLIMNAIPMGGRQTKYIQHIYTQRALFHCFMAKWVLYGEIRMLERDFFIWNHKKNIRNPIYVPEDRTLKQFRMWYSQFYKRKRNITIRNSTDANRNSVNTCKSSIDF